MAQRNFQEPILRYWQTYINVTQKYWNKHPELLAAGFSILLRPTVGQGFRYALRQYYNDFRTLFGFLFGEKAKNISLPNSAVLLFASTNKPSWMPAIEKLAESLALRDFNCAVLTLDDMKICRKRQRIERLEVCDESVPEYLQWIYCRLPYENVISLIYRSFSATLLLLKAAINDRPLFFYLLCNLFHTWIELFMSLHRFYALNQVLEQCSPKFILVNHERLPIAAELLLLKKPENVHTVLFTNEWPTIELLPLLSKEVWVWNERIASGLKNILPKSNLPKINIIGITELDYINELLEASCGYENLKHKVEDKPTILFLSQAVPNRVNSMVTEKMLSWLEEAAILCKDWYFIYKSRPGREDSGINGLIRLSRLPNFFISDKELTLKHLLKLDNIKIVCALNSSGLVIATGMGKLACRFVVSDSIMEYPFLNEITMPVHSATRLIDLLQRCSQDDFSKMDIGDEIEIFPYRGETIKRMEHLCLQHL